MIARLRGTVVNSDGEQLVLDVRGVGYLVTASEKAHATLDPKSSDEIELIVYTDVKENDISLFGFVDELERQVFLLLKKVKGIGSRLALTIVSALGSEELLAMISSGDVQSLTKVPGIGKKTAERAIVELREQVGQMAQAVAPLSRQIEISHAPAVSSELTGSSHLSGAQLDACLALQKLGFSEERAKRAVERVVESVDNAASLDAGELLQNALTQM